MRSTLLCCVALMLTACGLGLSTEDRLARGEEALAAGNLRAAIIDAKEVLRDEPTNARGRVLLGRASAASGDGASAEKELRRAIELGVPINSVVTALARGLLQQRKFQVIVDELQPTDELNQEDRLQLKLIRGDAYMGLGQTAAARALFEEVLTADPKNFGAHLGAAASHRAEGNFAEAVRILNRLTREFPAEVRGWLAAGELAMQQRDHSAAIKNYEKAVVVAAADNILAAEVQALSGMTEALFASGRTDEARISIARMVELAPNSQPALYQSAQAAFLDEDWSAAQSNLQRILQQSPDDRPAQTLLGAVYLKAGNLSQAEMYLSAVVAATPENRQARQLLAEAQLRQKEARQAQETLAPLVALGNTDSVALTMAARASVGQGDSDAAIDFLRRGVENEPDNIDLKFRLAVALMNAGRGDEFEAVLRSIDVGDSRTDEFRRDFLNALATSRTAGLQQGLAAASKLADDWPKNPNAHTLLGSVQFALEDLAAARSSFNAAVALQPGDLTAIRNLALLDEREGDVAAARKRFELILEAQPNATWAMFGVARLAAQGGDVAASRKWLQRIRSLDPMAIQPRKSLAVLLMADGDFVEAEKVIEEALNHANESADLHDLLGQARAAQGDHAGATIAYRRALDIEPDNDRLRLSLAQAQREVGNEALAQQTLSQSGNVSIDHIPSAVTAASLRVESGDLGGAMEIAKALQEHHPASPVPLALEAEIHVRSDRLQHAVEAYDRAMAIDVMRSHALRAHRIKTELGHPDRSRPLQAWLAKRPDDSDARLILAGSLQADGRLDEAIGEYLLVLKSDPTNGAALNNLAWTYYLAGDGRAVETARKAFALLPDSGSVADTLGWILVESGDIDEGVEVLRKAVDLSNNRAEVQYHYAASLARTGKLDDARRILQSILNSNDDFASRGAAEQLLADL